MWRWLRYPAPRSADAQSYLPTSGLPGIEPKQPKKPKTTASSAGLTTLARCRSCPPTSYPPQHTYQLQECGARRAISPAFISSPALLHQRHAQPRAATRFLQNAESVICIPGRACIGALA
eukprot:COSAG02_NODE_1690_length_11299_cov_21.781071_6_plen_120_part_00